MKAKFQTSHPTRPKVFGIGLSRTGTTSLSTALNILGLHECHFPCDPLTRREVQEWLKDRTSKLVLTTLLEADALTDAPATFAYDALDAAYPNSKFVCTIRDKQAWLKSCKRYWQQILAPYFRCEPKSEHVGYLREVSETLYRSVHFDPFLFSNAFDCHVARVQRHFSEHPQDLLLLDICGHEGWPQLCEFLSMPVPAVQFPFKNRLVASWL